MVTSVWWELSDQLDRTLQSAARGDVASELLSLLVAALRSDAGFIGILDADQGSLTLVAQRSAAGNEASAVVARADFRPSWLRALAGGGAACACDASYEDDSRPSARTLCAAVMVEDQPVALLCVSLPHQPYSQADHELLTRAARRLAPHLSAQRSEAQLLRKLANSEDMVGALQRVNTRVQHERRIAKSMMGRLRHDDALTDPGIWYAQSSFELFNGDLVLGALGPSGELRCLIGDFTGHGFGAAIGSIPLMTTFYDTTRKGVDLLQSIATMNDVLKQMLPPEIFCAAIVFALSADGRQLTVWNGGLPPLYVRTDHEGPLKRARSENLALGIVASQDVELRLSELTVDPQDEILAFSDGVTECMNPLGERLGVARVEQVLMAAPPGDGCWTLPVAVDEFRGASVESDDCSLLSLNVAQWLAGQAAKIASTVTR
jgi:serine phosphatase RsbU (regulator of sigma subunit)